MVQPVESVSPYADQWEHFAEELKWLDMRIAMEMHRRGGTEADEEDLMEPFRGLVVSEQEVYRLLDDSVNGAPPDEEWQELLGAWQELRTQIDQRVEHSLRTGIRLSLPELGGRFGLSSFEQRCILLCLAVELDRKYEKLYAYLQDDVTSKYPTLDLTLRLLCTTLEEEVEARRLLLPTGQLRTWLLGRSVEGAEDKQSWLAQTLRLDQRVVHFLLHHTEQDEELLGVAELHAPDADLPPFLWEAEVQEELRRSVASQAGNRLVVLLQGNRGAGKKLHTKSLCQHLHRPLLLVDLSHALQMERPLRDTLRRAVRESLLQGAVLALEHVHIPLEEEVAAKYIPVLLEAIHEAHAPVILLAEREVRAHHLRGRHPILDFPLQIPPEEVRRAIWEGKGAAYEFAAPVSWMQLSGQFRFTVGQIESALTEAAAISEREGDKVRIGLDTLYRSCYGQVQHRLEKKAVRLKPRYGWSDLVLPPDQKSLLQNACNHLKYRVHVFGDWGFDGKLSYGKGLSLLFAGPPGTGKTMSAEVIAKELRLEIYKIDLAQVISKYIGETEKNLKEIFAEAQLSNSILFFDEADALFGKRSEVKDSHDKYANIETAYLLQKMEEYEGITILATNYQQNMDEAFMRRFQFVIKFPFPDAEHREHIWRGMIPAQAPLADDIDFAFLAQKFQIAGGHIKNVVLSAAFLAAEQGGRIGMKHMIKAVRHELQKTGKILLREELGEYIDL